MKPSPVVPVTPPPSLPKKSGGFRRFVIYSTLLAYVFPEALLALTEGESSRMWADDRISLLPFVHRATAVPAANSNSAGFYSAGTYAALQSPAVEDLFIAYVPGGEKCVEWAEDQGLDRVGAGEVAGSVPFPSSSATCHRGLTSHYPPTWSAQSRLLALQESHVDCLLRRLGCHSCPL